MHFPLPKPILHGQIAQVYSQTSNPTAASLLSIPAELRNEIYKYVLVDDEPIVLVDKAGDSVIKASSFAGNSSILQTCRQIYHEAIGVLYGQNVFQFNYKVLSDCWDRHTIIVNPIETCHKWTQDIGSSLSKLHTIAINLATPDIPADSRDDSPWDDFDSYSRRYMKILPLLDVFWGGVACDLSVRFESTRNRNHPYSSSYPSRFNVKLLTKVIYELGNMDKLRLMKARRLISDVEVAPHGKQGSIEFRSSNGKAGVRRGFQFSKNTQRYALTPSHPKFLDLPRKILKRIAMSVYKNHEVTYDFNTGVSHGLGFNMLDINSHLRKMMLVDFHHQSRFVIILGSATLSASEAMFEKLERRTADYYAPYMGRLQRCTPISASQVYKIAPTIVLRFQTDKPLHLAKVRINARDLLRATSVFPADTTIVVRVCGLDVTQDHTTRLGEIRKHVLVLMEHSLEFIMAVRDPMVEIELNHNCLPVRVTYWGDLGFLCGVRNCDRTVETVDIASLQEMVRARTWTPERHMNGFLSYDMPEGWDGQTRCSLIKCLKNLCS